MTSGQIATFFSYFVKIFFIPAWSRETLGRKGAQEMLIRAIDVT
jgi:hypothetical protein